MGQIHFKGVAAEDRTMDFMVAADRTDGVAVGALEQVLVGRLQNARIFLNLGRLTLQLLHVLSIIATDMDFSLDPPLGEFSCHAGEEEQG